MDRTIILTSTAQCNSWRWSVRLGVALATHGLRFVRRNLERRISLGWDSQGSQLLERVLAAEEALSPEVRR